MRWILEQLRSGWVIKGGIVLALMLLVNGCAPASGTKYARHLSASHQPSSINMESYAAAQRLYGEPQAATVLAGAMEDDADHHR